MGGLGAQGRIANRLFQLSGKEERHRREPHQGTVSRGAFVGGSGVRLAGSLVGLERPPGRVPDVEAVALRAQIALFVPAKVAAELINGIKTARFHQALGQAERHGGVVGPLAGAEVVGSAAAKALDREKGAPGQKLHLRPQRVADGEAKKRAR